MVTNGPRAREIAESVKNIGVDATAEAFSMNRETVRRYIRASKESEGTPVDNLPADILAKKLTERFSEKELKAMLDDKSVRHDNHHKSEHNFTGEWFKFGVLSDCHIGSNHTDEDELIAAIGEIERSGCEMILMPGDVTEGMSGRDGHIYELTHIGYKAQRNAAVDILSRFNGEIKAISGNHDLWYASKANIGAMIVEDICGELPNAEYLGEHEGSIFFNGARVDLWHGEDGSSYALSYRIQKIVESLEGGTKPNMIIAGHDHKSEFIPNLRNIMALEAGCIEHQTPWMRRKKLAAFVGFWIVELCIRDKEIVRVKPEWIPLF